MRSLTGNGKGCSEGVAAGLLRVVVGGVRAFGEAHPACGIEQQDSRAARPVVRRGDEGRG